MHSTLKIIIFLALISTALQQGLQCNINNCQYCSFPNFCGQCNNNNLLTLNTTSGDFYCSAVNCASNCMTCYQNNTCQTCNNNYFLTINGTCSTNPSSSNILSANCIWAPNATNCGLCAYGYTLLSGYCYPIITITVSEPNCIVKMTSSICQLCQNNYIVNMFGICIQNQITSSCNSANCAFCQNSNSTCQICNQGYQLSPSGTCLTPTCTIQGCNLCSNSTSCQICSPEYILTQTKSCQAIGLGCNIKWCQTCSSSQSCGQCISGYQLIQFNTNTNTTIYLCQQIICPFNINNCNQCVYTYNNNFQYNQILCSKNNCNLGYINVNGYCVPNLTTVMNTCTISNCVQCSYMNFCSVCQAGYSLTRYGTCQINTCNIANCVMCSLNNICQQCSSSYSLTISNLSLVQPSNQINFIQFILQQQCTLNTGILCTNANCQYCSSNNICAQCSTGYDFDTSMKNCIQTCNINNCYVCSQTLNITTAPCSLCSPGYQLSSNNMSCIQINFSCGTGCSNSSCIFSTMTLQGQCIQCMSNMILYNGQCISSTCNIYGCQICAPWALPNLLCLQCQQSLVLSDGYCIIPNCDNNVPNCVNCIQGGGCVGCKQGYFIQNSTNGTTSCVSQTSILNCNVQNCVQCQSGNSNICTLCATPYKPLNGQCVCGFANCLDCSTSVLTCNLCPPPLIANLQDPNCLPQPSLINTCNLSNCQACLTTTQCSLCSLGYTLTNYTCQINNCSALSNCQLCDQFAYSCHMCKTGFMINNFLEGGSCFPINPNYTCNITGCAVCSSTNNSICSSCLPTYYSNGSTSCLPNGCNITNCYLCLDNNICTVCLTGYYLALDSSCQPKFSSYQNCQGQIQYCDICVSGLAGPPHSIYCIKCQNGFLFSIINSQCMPQTNSIPNCKVQLPDYNNNYIPICMVCQQGYYINSWGLCSMYNPAINNTNCTVYNCLYCALNSTTCSFCFAPWGISQFGLCQTNISTICNNLPNCVSCINSTNCSTCAATYLPYQGQCLSCNIIGCSYCITPNVCSVCLLGFTINSNNNICISCNIPNCNNCSNNNVCSNCATGFLISSSGNNCVTCSLSNCQSCSSNNLCGVCNAGYQLYMSTCIQCNVNNCITCNSNNTCQTCAFGYSLVSGNCLSCNYPCATCDSNANCITCKVPFFALNATANGSCITSTVSNCIAYSSLNTTLCTQCQGTYNLTVNNTCILSCNSICGTCSSPNICLSCNSGYYLTNTTCIQCQSTGCIQCNATTCLSCSNGFYIMNNECVPCAGYCSSCSSTGICTQLVQSNQQVLITINSQTFLAICPQTCLSCSNVNPSICLTCLDGFYLDNISSICAQCNQACRTCSSSNINQCFTCYPNNFLVNNTCVACSSTCKSCGNSNSTTTCVTCFPGSYLNNNTCTQGCSNNCATCSSPQLCISCDSGYSLFSLPNNNQICVQCISNCRTCGSGLPATCLSCGDGFYLSNNNCVACTTNCGLCTSSGCSNCVNGFFLTSSLTCSVNCQIPCAACSSNNPTKCSSCIAGYTYNSLLFSCIKQTTCSSACSTCPIGYILQNGLCNQCNTSNCHICSSTNLNQCLSCAPGFYLNPSGSQCQPCLPQCSTCLRGDGCITCNSGYTYLANVNLAGNGYQCVTCNFPCATCLNDPDYCTSCVNGYSFMGWKCSQSFYFSFSVTLLTNSTVFNQNYYNLILSLANSIGSTNPQIITITGITFGSVIVTGGVAPSALTGTLQSNQQFNSLDSTLSTNNIIAGMTVGTSTISVINGSIDYSKINLALILGITIPLAVLIIAGIVLFIYCRKKKSSDILEQKIKQNSGFTVRQSFELSTKYKQQDSSRPFQEDTGIN